MNNPADFFKLIAEQNRLQLVCLLVQQGELCVCELTTATGLLQPQVSRHLTILKKAGLLIDRRQGQWVYYQLNPLLPGWITTILQQTVLHNSELLTPLLHNLQNMIDRPQRCD